MKALKIISIVVVVAVAGIGIYRYQQIAQGNKGSQAQLLSALRAQQHSVKESPTARAWKAGDVSALTNMLKADEKPQTTQDNLQTLIRAIDTDESTLLDVEGRVKLFDHTLSLVDQLEGQPRQARARTQVLATHLLRRLATRIEGTEATTRAQAITAKCTGFSRDNDLCTGLIETAAAFPNSDPALVSILTKDLGAKDPVAIQHAIMTGESLRDPALRNRFREELMTRFEKLEDASKPLALRSLVDLFRDSPTLVQGKIRKIASSNEDRWADVFLYSVSTLELTDQYRQDIERISRQASSPTIRTKASTLLQQKGDKR